jgi:hypothetical protein
MAGRELGDIDAAALEALGNDKRRLKGAFEGFWE